MTLNVGFFHRDIRTCRFPVIVVVKTIHLFEEHCSLIVDTFRERKKERKRTSSADCQ